MAYDVWRERTIDVQTGMGILRSTFVIDADGIATRVTHDVRPCDHVDALIEALG